MRSLSAKKPQEPAVEVIGLKKSFVTGLFRRKSKAVLKGIDLTVPKGAFWCLLGPNGAGKTTFLSILCNLITPDEGIVRILGRDLKGNSREILRLINISSGHANFLWSMNVRENLNYYAMLYGLTGSTRKRRLDYLLDLFELRSHEGARFDELSTGTKQRLSLAKSLLNSPQLLFLDEPTVGLDPDVAQKTRQAIMELHSREGTTILMTTHNMKEAEAMCQEAAFIREGTIKAVGRPSELKRELGLGDRIGLHIDNEVSLEGIEGLQGVFGVSQQDRTVLLTVDDHRVRVPAVLEYVSALGGRVVRIEIRQSDLEDVFFAYSR